VTRRDEAVAAALRILESEGEQSLTMRRVADEVGIRAPSLYKHLSGRDELIAALQAEGLAAMGVAFAGASRSRSPRRRLAALATAYRRFALEHPELYRQTAGRPLLRDLLPEGVEDEVGSVLVSAVGGHGDRARAVWAFAHGMADLELADRFPPGADVDAAWRAGVTAFSPA
jgi:AcrR family transcriptional regulator